MAERFCRKRRRSSSSSSTTSLKSYEEEEEGEIPSNSILHVNESNEPEAISPLDQEDRLKYRYVFDYCCFDLTLAYFYMNLKTLKKIHLSVCRYMNGCLKKQMFILDFYLYDRSRVMCRGLIRKIKCMLNMMNLQEKTECCRFWKVKRVQIAKALLDCSDKKTQLFTCTKEIEKILYNGMCYASLRKGHSDKLYKLCLLIKALYAVGCLDYNNIKSVY